MPIFSTSDFCKIYYESKGQGEPVILVHGLSSDHFVWKDVVKYLSKKYQVITYDQRGHGASSKDAKFVDGKLNMKLLARDLHELIEFFGFEKVNILGWSLGATTEWAYLREYGTEYLKTMSFVDMSPKCVSEGDWTLGQWCGEYTADVDRMLRHKFQTDFPTAMQIQAPYAQRRTPQEVSPEMAAIMSKVWDELLANCNPSIMAALWSDFCEQDYREDVKKDDVPTFLAYSGDGRDFCPENGEWIRDQIPGPAKLVIFENSGHGLVLEESDKFCRELEAFLDTYN